MNTARLQENHPEVRGNPLLYVIAVVDIVPLRGLESYIPRIQDALRLKGYPFNSEQSATEIVVDTSSVTSKAIKQWAFINLDRTSSILLLESKIALETTKYSIFSEFQAEMERILEVLSLIDGSIFTRQFGLRYINAIQPALGTAYNSLLHPSLSGFDDGFAGVSDAVFSINFQGKSEHGVLTIRVHQPPPDLAASQEAPLLAPDLTTLLNVPEKVDVRRQYRLLDLDHTTSKEVEFSIPHVIATFDQLHDTLDTAFRDSVSLEAYKRLATDA